jgi:cytochrome P450
MKKQITAGTFFMKELDSPEKRLFPFSVLNELRESTPVRYDENRQCGDVFLYEDVDAILRNHDLFSSERKRTVEHDDILTMDPPRHNHMRNLVSKAFSPKAMQNQETKIRELANDLLSQVLDQGHMNMIHDLAAPLPVIIIAEMLGVPKEDRLIFKEWSDTVIKGVSGYSQKEYEAVAAEHERVNQELTQYFLSMMAKRRQEPQADLITSLLHAEIDGEKLTDKEIVDFCILLLVAGNETTTNLITHGIRVLTEQPELQSTLKQDPALIPSFVEETLRYYSPVLGQARIAKQDAEIRGQQIRQGDTVTVWLAAANRDPRKFAKPDRFKVDRSPNPHLSFGKGIHFCLGAPLARLEARIAFETILGRMANLRLKEGTNLVINPAPFLYGVHEYPITFARV